MKRAMLMVVALWMVSAGTAWSMDQIYTSTAEKAHYNGKIVTMTPTTVNFEPQRKEWPSEIPANEIARIIYGDTPQGLYEAQRAMAVGDYDKAVEALKKEAEEDQRREVGDEIAFCRAYCTTQLAISGAADPNEAGKLMLKFIKNSPNSFHYFKACELMGDICVTLGNFADAQKYYAILSQAPWPDYKIRAQVALGRSCLAQDKAAAADKAFDDALINDAPGELAEAQRTAARIGKARCMVLAGKADQALRSLGEVLDRTDEKDPEINAMAYNALGTALRKANKPKQAIRAFLRVHIDYSTQPDQDAEAVANLERLFTEDNKVIHARDMREILDEKYKNSRWAKGLK